MPGGLCRSRIILWATLALALWATDETAWAAEPAGPRARLESIAFVSSHHLLCQNTRDLLSGGTRYPTTEWLRQPSRNVPLTHTGSQRVRLRVMLHVEGLSKRAPFVLIGRSKEPGLCFRKTGRIGNGDSKVEVEAGVILGREIRTLDGPIAWTLELDPGASLVQTLPLGETGPHRIYVTRGTPKGMADPLSVVTEIRMERAIEVVRAALAKSGQGASDARLVHEVMKLNARYYRPSRHYARDHAWLVPESWALEPAGASCISIVWFVDLVCKMIGVEGETRLIAVYGDPERPHHALGGGLGDHPLRKTATDGSVWQLFMVDESNTNRGGVGGVGGMNYYEAALEYRFKGRRYYLPGGTDTILDSPDGVLWVFRSLAWARFDPYLQNWVVTEVVGTYGASDSDFPRSVALP